MSFLFDPLAFLCCIFLFIIALLLYKLNVLFILSILSSQWIVNFLILSRPNLVFRLYFSLVEWFCIPCISFSIEIFLSFCSMLIKLKSYIVLIYRHLIFFNPGIWFNLFHVICVRNSDRLTFEIIIFLWILVVNKSRDNDRVLVIMLMNAGDIKGIIILNDFFYFWFFLVI